MIIVAGSIRVPDDRIYDLMPAMHDVIAATRREPGCITYSYAFDVEDRGLVRIFEEWESRTELEAHFRQPHMGPWRLKLVEVGARGRSLSIYEAAPGEPI
ncbi:putative quinol monooxygenase [Faunimonas sp. B44]|uniref:putative quinol monooxygenase n=1 Tax=Faunimonas sp. B44 TaxID=3461493 RepID=UPI0040440BF1